MVLPLSVGGIHPAAVNRQRKHSGLCQINGFLPEMEREVE
jgi:hypothetical protein